MVKISQTRINFELAFAPFVQSTATPYAVHRSAPADTGAFRLQDRLTDCSTLPSGLLSRIKVSTSTSLTLPLKRWTVQVLYLLPAHIHTHRCYAKSAHRAAAKLNYVHTQLDAAWHLNSRVAASPPLKHVPVYVYIYIYTYAPPTPHLSVHIHIHKYGYTLCTYN